MSMTTKQYWSINKCLYVRLSTSRPQLEISSTTNMSLRLTCRENTPTLRQKNSVEHNVDLIYIAVTGILLNC